MSKLSSTYCSSPPGTAECIYSGIKFFLHPRLPLIRMSPASMQQPNLSFLPWESESGHSTDNVATQRLCSPASPKSSSFCSLLPAMVQLSTWKSPIEEPGPLVLYFQFFSGPVSSKHLVCVVPEASAGSWPLTDCTEFSGR